MNIKRLSDNLIQCIVSASELRTYGIDPGNFLNSPEDIRKLYSEIINTVIKKFPSDDGQIPYILEAIPTYDALTVVLAIDNLKASEVSDEKNNTSQSNDTSPEGNVSEINRTGNFSETAVLMPIDELQASVISDLISAAENGNIVEHLKKYLNEDFLDSLIRALSESGLESLISSFFAPPGPSSEEAALTQAMSESGGSNISTAEFSENHSVLKEKPKEPQKEERLPRKLCVFVSFKSINEAERALSECHIQNFPGKSTMFHIKKREYLLVLNSDGLNAEEFRKYTAPLMNFYNAHEKPYERFIYLLEHETPLIEENAVEILSGSKLK